MKIVEISRIRIGRRIICVLASCFLLLLGCRYTNDIGGLSEIDCAKTAKVRSPLMYLSQTCLYSDIESFQVSKQLVKFTPNYQLWSDGATKSRWMYLPPNSKVDTSDPDRWRFPVGTQFFKEFRQFPKGASREIKVETRHFQKITPGEGEDSWLISTYMWNAEQTEAILSEGASNVLNTDHDIPTNEDCVNCHKGNVDIILGFEAIQLSDKQGKLAFGHGPKRTRGESTLRQLNAQGLLSHPVSEPTLPGTPVEQQALGYLHANCGNCHNPLGHAAEQDAEHLKMRHKLEFNKIEETHVYRTAVNQETRNFTVVPYIIMGAKEEELALYQSAVFLRMNSVHEDYRMPMLAREKVDYQGLELMHRWFMTLPTPEDFVFEKQGKKSGSSSQTFGDRSQVLSGNGLQLELQFFEQQHMAPVIAMYWPEDNSLKTEPIMDHEYGYFSSKLIVGNKGDTMSLRNSDDVGHTIYVRDKKQDVKWQLSYMPPGSRFEQELFWENDVFVELKCRLHLYMSAWAGSISSRYHKVVELKENESYLVTSMTDYPEEFTRLNIWLPKYELIKTEITIGQEQAFVLKKGDKEVGKIRIKRFRQ